MNTGGRRCQGDICQTEDIHMAGHVHVEALVMTNVTW